MRREVKWEEAVDTLLPETRAIADRTLIAFSVAGEEIVLLSFEASEVPCRISCEAFLRWVQQRMQATLTDFESNLWFVGANDRLFPNDIWGEQMTSTVRHDQSCVEVLVVLARSAAFDFFDTKVLEEVEEEEDAGEEADDYYEMSSAAAANTAYHNLLLRTAATAATAITAAAATTAAAASRSTSSSASSSPASTVSTPPDSPLFYPLMPPTAHPPLVTRIVWH